VKRVRHTTEQGIELSYIEIPYEVFKTDFPSPRKAKKWVRLLPLTTNIKQIQGKNAHIIRKHFMDANILSTKLALERYLYEHPNAEVVTPIELARLILRRMTTIYDRVVWPKMRRKSLVRQIANNIELALDSSEFAKRLDAPLENAYNPNARFRIVKSKIKPCSHRLLPLTSSFHKRLEMRDKGVLKASIRMLLLPYATIRFTVKQK
jgi:hypothetical protein